MITRRFLLQSSAASAACLASGVWPAWAENAPGVTDTEIKIGQTMPYSGPASAYGVIGRAELAYFKMINEHGGVNGRKINLVSLDDAYTPSNTVEQTRRLIEQERIAFIFGSLGGYTNLSRAGGSPLRACPRRVGSLGKAGTPHGQSHRRAFASRPVFGPFARVGWRPGRDAT